eukprot:3038332-Rhodomonas_salina.3
MIPCNSSSHTANQSPSAPNPPANHPNLAKQRDLPLFPSQESHSKFQPSNSRFPGTKSNGPYKYLIGRYFECQRGGGLAKTFAPFSAFLLHAEGADPSLFSTLAVFLFPPH